MKNLTKVQKRKRTAAIENVIKAHGFKADRWGNFKNLDGSERFKFMDNNLRYERKSKAGKKWLKIKSDAYKTFTVENGQLFHGILPLLDNSLFAEKPENVEKPEKPKKPEKPEDATLKAQNLVDSIKAKQEKAKLDLIAAKEALKAAKQAVRYSKVDSIKDAIYGMEKPSTFLEICNSANLLRTGKALSVNHKAFDVYKYTIAGILAFGIIKTQDKGPVSPASKVKYTLVRSEKPEND